MFRETPVDDDRLAERPDEDVGRFQIAVKNAEAVRVRHRLGDIHEHAAERDALREIRRVSERFGERLPLDELLRVKRLPVRPSAGVVERDDVRVRELRRDANLCESAQPPSGRRASALSMRRTDRSGRRARPEDASDPAAGDLLADLVTIRGYDIVVERRGSRSRG